MVGNEHPPHGPGKPAGFWRSPAGLALAAFLVIGAVLLVYEHRVHLFAGGYGNVLLFVGALAAHGLMHRGHGGHGSGGHGGHRHRPGEPQKPGEEDTQR